MERTRPRWKKGSRSTARDQEGQNQLKSNPVYDGHIYLNQGIGVEIRFRSVSGRSHSTSQSHGL